jgi:hypothetical protein
MYGLPTDTDLSFLNDCELNQICVGLHEVILNFQGEVSIYVGGDYDIDGNAGTPQELFRFLGSRITAATNAGNGTICLSFMDDRRLSIHDSETHYESYTITAPEKYIVV